jgi:hypothetical protein
MLKLLDRTIVSASERIVFLAPSSESVSDVFHNVEIDGFRHQQLVRDVQRMRGSIYVSDGAIQPHQLTTDGRHQMPEDETSWHLLLLNKEGRVAASALYLEHDNTVTFDELRVRQCPLSEDPQWRSTLVDSIEIELKRARREQLVFVELAGWAVSEETRGTSSALAFAMAVYAFSRRAGGALGMTTATFRHCSSTILKRFGGAHFEVDGVTVPPYFDPRYGCMMEMLRFDSRTPTSKYRYLIDQMRDTLAGIAVIARSPSREAEAPFGMFSPVSARFERRVLAS